MATRKNGKTYDDYYNQQLGINNAAAEKQVADITASTQKSITDYNTTVDTATENTVGKYQQRIDEAPKVYQEQYDLNAIAELVNKRQLEESMANMGLTDSGTNRSQQTALSVMRGNADAATRRQEQDYVNQLTTAIDDVRAESEANKANYANQMNTALDENVAAIWNNAQTLSAEQATSLYNQQEQNLTNEYVAQQEAETAQTQARYDALSALDDKRVDYAQFLMKNGSDEDAAWAGAYTIYPTGDKGVDTYSTAYSQAIKSGYDPTYAKAIATAAKEGVSEGDAIASLAEEELKTARIDTSTLAKFHNPQWMDWSTSERKDLMNVMVANRGAGYAQDDWNTIIGKIYEDATEKLANTTMTETAKGYAAAKAVGQVLYKVCETYDKYEGTTPIGAIDEYVPREKSAVGMYNALGTLFSGSLFDLACKEAGIEIKDGEASIETKDE